MNETNAKPQSLRDRSGARRSLDRAITGVGRRAVGAPTHAESGRVARLYVDGGFGFVRTHAGVMAYFSREDVLGVAFEALEPGARVAFELGGDGTPRARGVTRDGGAGGAVGGDAVADDAATDERRRG